MRVRCSTGLDVESYSGHCYRCVLRGAQPLQHTRTHTHTLCLRVRTPVRLPHHPALPPKPAGRHTVPCRAGLHHTPLLLFASPLLASALCFLSHPALAAAPTFPTAPAPIAASNACIQCLHVVVHAVHWVGCRPPNAPDVQLPAVLFPSPCTQTLHACMRARIPCNARALPGCGAGRPTPPTSTSRPSTATRRCWRA